MDKIRDKGYQPKTNKDKNPPKIGPKGGSGSSEVVKERKFNLEEQSFVRFYSDDGIKIEMPRFSRKKVMNLIPYIAEKTDNILFSFWNENTQSIDYEFFYKCYFEYLLQCGELFDVENPRIIIDKV